MAWQPNFVVNQPHPMGVFPDGDTGGMLYSLLVALETAGWTVVQSGDGHAVTDPGNAFTAGCGHRFQASVGPNDWSHAGAWYVVRMPGSTLEIAVWRDTVAAWANQGFFQIKVSPTGFTDNALRTSTHPPNAADEQAVWGTLPAAFADLPTTTADAYAHCAANDAANEGVYSFWAASKDQGANNLRAFILFDAPATDPETTETTGILADPAPWMLYVATGLTCADYGIIGAAGSGPFAYRDYGGGTELFVRHTALVYATGGLGLVAPRNLAQGVDGYVRGLPIAMHSSAAGSWKGFLNSARWKPLAGRGYPDRDSPDSTADAGPKLYVGDLILPWKKTTVPL